MLIEVYRGNKDYNSHERWVYDNTGWTDGNGNHKCTELMISDFNFGIYYKTFEDVEDVHSHRLFYILNLLRYGNKYDDQKIDECIEYLTNVLKQYK